MWGGHWGTDGATLVLPWTLLGCDCLKRTCQLYTERYSSCGSRSTADGDGDATADDASTAAAGQHFNKQEGENKC